MRKPMIPDAEVGKYVLIYASHEFLPPLIGAIMMTTIVGIIISTADSYLLVPTTTPRYVPWRFISSTNVVPTYKMDYPKLRCSHLKKANYTCKHTVQLYF